METKKEVKYYDGSKLLNMRDLDGHKPRFFMVTSNRSAGKTTYFHRYLFNRFLKHGEKFAILYRYKDMLDDLDGKFFKDIGPLFFPDYLCKAVKKSHGDYIELYTCKRGEEENEEAWKCCGYGLALNTANKLKNFSHYFSDIKTMYFDEFQAEFSEYCPKELNKFFNIYATIARGHGEQFRYLPVIMSANTVSVINPYFSYFKITNRLQSNTKFLRGHDYVLECNFNESASNAMQEASFMKYSDDKYLQYQSGGVYCLDNTAFLEKKTGMNRYVCTILLHGREYGVRLYDDGILYINKQPDKTSPNRFSGDIESHNLSTIITPSAVYKKQLIEYFNRGYLRFYDLETKTDIIEFLTSGYH